MSDLNDWGDPDAKREIDEAWDSLTGAGYTKGKIGFTHHSMGWVNPPPEAFHEGTPGRKIFSMHSVGGMNDDGTYFRTTQICTDQGNFVQKNGGPWVPIPVPFWKKVKWTLYNWRVRLLKRIRRN